MTQIDHQDLKMLLQAFGVNFVITGGFIHVQTPSIGVHLGSKSSFPSAKSTIQIYVFTRLRSFCAINRKNRFIFTIYCSVRKKLPGLYIRSLAREASPWSPKKSYIGHNMRTVKDLSLPTQTVNMDVF